MPLFWSSVAGALAWTENERLLFTASEPQPSCKHCTVRAAPIFLLSDVKVKCCQASAVVTRELKP